MAKHKSNGTGCAVRITERIEEVFVDGTMIELMRHDAGENSECVYFHGANSPLTSDKSRRVLLLSKMAEQIPAGLRLPSANCNYHSTPQLIGHIANVLKQHPGLSEEPIAKLVLWTVSTWFPECGLIAPCVSVFCPDSASSTLLLRMLHCVCRRALRVTGITRNSLFSLPLQVRPTILIDEPAPTRELLRTIRAIIRPGNVLIHGRNSGEVACASAICSAEPLSDPWLRENAIHVALGPANAALPSVSQERLDRCAADLQAKLLQYRFRNFTTVRNAQFESSGLTGVTAEIARTLAASIVGDNELQSRIVGLLKDQDSGVRARRSITLEAITIEAALCLCHESNRSFAYVKEITDVVNGIFADRGETVQEESRKIGSVLNTIGLFTKELGSAGYGVEFFNDVRQKIHELANTFDVRSVRQGKRRCVFCKAIRKEYSNQAAD